MSSEQPRQDWPTPPGYPPSGPPSAPPYGAPVGPPPAAPASSSHRTAWIGAGATLVAAVIGVLGTYLVTGSGGSKGTPAPERAAAESAPATGAQAQGGAAAPSASAPAQSPSAPQASASASAPAAGKPAGTVQWEGALAIEYGHDKDLDASPPAQSEINSENDFMVFSFGNLRLRPQGGAKALVWEDSSKVPTYADCAGVIDTLGTTKDLDLKTGRIFCGRTDDGRVLRLTTKTFDGGGGTANGTFDVVVWAK
ncbi:hypothetical protein [Streptomyces sp. NPDC048606]|uniref:hypothetical protein n=1 Tax=Streptomyces sp. NPDC048606 TaxID=3154726 RepID=UPI003415B633